MKPRFLFGVLAELAVAAVALLMGKVLIEAGFDALPAALVDWMRAQDGFLGGMLDFVLECGAYVLYLAVWALLRTAVRSLLRQEETGGPSPADASPARGPAHPPNPAQICPASVVQKRKRTAGRKRGAPGETQYYAIFGLGRYQRVEFPIPRELYQTLSGGDRGTLAYRQEGGKKTFLWFRKDGEEIGS